MNTIIFLWEENEDYLNDNQAIKQLLDGKGVDWKTWYDGDGRYKPTHAENGDRYFICQKSKGLIAAGCIENVEFVRGGAKLSGSGMTHFQLIPEKSGEPVLPIENVKEILIKAGKANAEEELLIDNKADAAILEGMWLKAVIENNPCYDRIKEDFWSIENLHAQTLSTIYNQLLTANKTCPCCGKEINKNSELFFRPSMVKSDYPPINSYEDLIPQFAILCKDCAEIQRKLR